MRRTDGCAENENVSGEEGKTPGPGACMRRKGNFCADAWTQRTERADARSVIFSMNMELALK